LIFRNPLAWIGLATLLVPIAIHLLVRSPAQPIVLASLRFLPTSPMRAPRRRLLNDAALLALRMTILAIAVAALANPLVTNACRTRAWNARLARVVVHETQADAGAVSRARDDASPFTTTAIASDDLPGSLASATAWLALAPPGRREIVVVGHLPLGAIDETAVRDVPSSIGLRFVRTGTTRASATLDGTVVTRATDSGLSTVQSGLALEGDRTIVRPADSTPLANAIEATRLGWRSPRLAIDLVGNESTRPTLRAALVAALGVGAPVLASGAAHPLVMQVAATPGLAGWTPRIEPLSEAWMAATVERLVSDAALARSTRGVRALTREPLPAPWLTILNDEDGRAIVAATGTTSTAAGRDVRALFVLARVDVVSPVSAALAHALLASRDDARRFARDEILPIPDAQLAAWSRAPGDVDPRRIGDAHVSDRRWFWAAALAVLGIEMMVRRRGVRRAVAPEGEVRDRAA
jgi:hypothetical protein